MTVGELLKQLAFCHPDSKVLVRSDIFKEHLGEKYEYLEVQKAGTGGQITLPGQSEKPGTFIITPTVILK